MAPDEQTHRDLDAPAPPGSPMREDTPDANVTPGDPTPPSQADFANAQTENAESSLDEPSDNSGAE